MDIRRDVLGIVVGGLPAPGINASISAIVIEAINRDLECVGFLQGWKHLRKGMTQKRMYLQVKDVTACSKEGGTMLGLSKAQLENEMDVDNTLRALQHLRIRYLITIGGARTAESALALAKAARAVDAQVSLVHIPISIFNDLPLPPACNCYGFDTARDLGARIVRNLARDAKALERFYIIQVIGSLSGHLTLGVGTSSGATNTIIPEEFAKYKKSNSVLDRLVDMLDMCFLKRMALNKPYGVICISEGLISMMSKEELARFCDGTRDGGHENLCSYIKSTLEERYRQRKCELWLRTKKVGVELRAADPNSLDLERATQIGYGAVSSLLRGDNGVFITLQQDDLAAVSISSVVGGGAGVRSVDLKSLRYEVASKYMIRFNRSDLRREGMSYKMSQMCNMEEAAFIDRFEYITR